MRTVKKLKSLAVAAMIAAGLGCTADAVAAKNVMCLKTNTGQYIEVVRVSMMQHLRDCGQGRRWCHGR